MNKFSDPNIIVKEELKYEDPMKYEAEDYRNIFLNLKEEVSK